MRVLLLTIGSAGDVHPFIGLGIALRQRGHSVKIITNPFFGEAAQRVGLELVPLGNIELFKSTLADPRLWHKRQGTVVVFKLVLDGLRETYDAVASNYVPGETVVVSSSLGFAARIAQDKLSIPTATVHLSPSQFRSCIAPPRLPGLWMAPWFPMWLKRRMWAGAGAAHQRAANRAGACPGDGDSARFLELTAARDRIVSRLVRRPAG